MAGRLKEKLEDAALWVGNEWDELVDRLGWGHDKPVTVANYRGFGRRDYLYLTGRVLRDRAIRRREQSHALRNLANNFKRFYSREIPGAEVRVEWAGQHFELITDGEGYFHLEHHFDPPIEFPSDELWQQAEITVTRIPGQDNIDYHSLSDVVLPQKAEFGIISDIDDTVLHSDVSSRLKLRTLYYTLLKNAGSRRAFKQVSAFYRALQLGPDGDGLNPFFYVSNSPWNLYDLLIDFLGINKMPRGPVLLRDFGLPYEERPEEYRGHKVSQVERIMQTYPDMPFILVGDSGEKDTDIYLSIARERPEQVKAIYIRDVQHTRRARRVEKIIEEYTDINVKLVNDYTEAAEHAAGMGLIDYSDFERMMVKK